MTLLLLAGTAEARDLAQRLAALPGVAAVASLAGATRHPARLPLETRIGGFGGAQGQRKWMQGNGIETVIDATHPFAAQISARTQALCAGLGVPYLRLQRPGWQAQPGDRWTRVPSLAAAAAAVPPGATVFLATGRQSLPAFAGRDDATVYLRQIDRPDAPFPRTRGDFIIGTPPFRAEEERHLFKRLGVDLLVAKDAGGPAGAKLVAARALALPVILIDRPPPPPGDVVTSVDAALAWLARVRPCD